MSRRAEKALLELNEAIRDLEDAPPCTEPHFRDLFFPEPAKSSAGRPLDFQVRISEQEAKILCNVCPVRALCAEYAVIGKQEFGVWGATTPSERRAIWSSVGATKPEDSATTQLF